VLFLALPALDTYQTKISLCLIAYRLLTEKL
jgi:hypothetical protein